MATRLPVRASNSLAKHRLTSLRLVCKPSPAAAVRVARNRSIQSARVMMLAFTPGLGPRPRIHDRTYTYDRVEQLIHMCGLNPLEYNLELGHLTYFDTA